jgi:two-component system, NtrC family, sensor kinase
MKAKVATLAAVEARADDVYQRIRSGITLGTISCEALLVWEFREERALVALIVSSFLALLLVNLVLTPLARRHIRSQVADLLRLPVNLCLVLIQGWATEWALPVWALLVLLAQMFDGLHDWQTRLRLTLFLLPANVMALSQGAPLPRALLFNALTVAAYVVSEVRAATIRRMLETADHQRQLLQRAYDELAGLQERMVVQEKLAGLGTMASGIAHEINNPMSFVTSNVSELLDDLKQLDPLPPPLDEYVEDILPATLDGIFRVNSIVADLRRFAHGEPEQVSRYNLSTEISAALRIAASQVKPGCAVEVCITEDLPLLTGRPRQIAQVLVNLLVNAAQATPAEGRITLSVTRQEEWIRVLVDDTGSGMSPDTVRQLFQPFFTTKPVGEGTGMGLATCHGIARSHGGTIEVSSTLGQGSQFTLVLPTIAPASDREEPDFSPQDWLRARASSRLQDS